MLTAKPRKIFPSCRDDSIRGRSELELRKHGVESCGNGRHRHRHPRSLKEPVGLKATSRQSRIIQAVSLAS